MSGYRGPGDGRGPGYGYYGPGDDPSSPPGGSSSLPAWALVLIMVGSGLLTLTVLGLFVLVLCRRRRARRAAMRGDLEAQAASDRETVRMLRTHAETKEAEEQANRCESDAGVELTFVVMAGEDQPSYLARPAAPISSTPLPRAEFEKEQQQQQPASGPRPAGLAAVATAYQPAHENPPKSPPSPSRDSS